MDKVNLMKGEELPLDMLDTIRWPKLGSPKIDGQRCGVVNGNAKTFSMKPLANIHTRTILSDPVYNGLDGELVASEPNDPEVFSKSQTAFRTIKGTPAFQYWVFDVFDAPGSTLERQEKLEEIVHELREEHHIRNVHIVPQKVLNSAEEFRAFSKSMLEQGFEGVILRDPDAPYKNGRSTVLEQIMLKVKPESDSEAVILGMAELIHKDSKTGAEWAGDTMGALIMRDIYSGVIFRVGTGFDAETRKELWQQRATLCDHKNMIPERVRRYKFLPVGIVTKPRSPRDGGARFDVDLDAIPLAYWTNLCVKNPGKVIPI